MRETCLFCVSKHLAQAVVLVNESVTGYPLHSWLAVGHLAEAETESVEKYPTFANKIRSVRLALMGQEGEFFPESLMNLLKEAREIAEIINGVDDRQRTHQILFRNANVTKKSED